MSDVLTGVWYVAATAQALNKTPLLRREMPQDPIALGRTPDGAPIALRDVCPHRAAPLSAGRFLDHGGAWTLECPYHGWRFRTDDGVCALIPSLTEHDDFTAENVGVPCFPMVERAGLVWIFIPQTPTTPSAKAPPLADPLADHAIADAAPDAIEILVTPGAPADIIARTMDPAAGPWATAKRHNTHAADAKLAAVTPTPQGFDARWDNANTACAAFALPGIRVESHGQDEARVHILTTVTPLAGDRTEILVAAYGLGAGGFGGGSTKRAVRDIAQSLATQGLSKSDAPWTGPRHFAPDWYAALATEWTRSQQNARPFQNPIADLIAPP